jgi:hypothetical protein
MLSIVGAETFHFSVRNGKRWCRIAQITRKFLSSILKELINDSSSRFYRSPYLLFVARLTEQSLEDCVVNFVDSQKGEEKDT